MCVHVGKTQENPVEMLLDSCEGLTRELEDRHKETNGQLPKRWCWLRVAERDLLRRGTVKYKLPETPSVTKCDHTVTDLRKRRLRYRDRTGVQGIGRATLTPSDSTAASPRQQS